MSRPQAAARFWRRGGATTVEFALVVPILLLVVFASVEFTRVHMIRHTADNAAYEAARRGIVPGATADDVEQAALAVLNTISVSNATVTISPETITDDTDEVTATVTVPFDSNGWIAPLFFAGKSTTSSLTLSRELHIAVP